jgi:putative Mg2+ transporter-C (MgtC) family protein
MDQLHLLGPLLVALVLSSLIGLEREIHNKSAGLRTHTLVGLGAALFMLVSKFGFNDIINGDTIRLDPSRLASTIVSGIGFIGAGLIFVRRDAVKGLTSAAVVWLTAAVGVAAGAGLWLVAVVAVLAHYLVTFVYPALKRRVPRLGRESAAVHVAYEDGRGVLRTVLSVSTDRGFTIEDVDVGRPRVDDQVVRLVMHLRGHGSYTDLVAALDDLDGVVGVRAGDPDVDDAD